MLSYCKDLDPKTFFPLPWADMIVPELCGSHIYMFSLQVPPPFTLHPLLNKMKHVDILIYILLCNNKSHICQWKNNSQISSAEYFEEISLWGQLVVGGRELSYFQQLVVGGRELFSNRRKLKEFNVTELSEIKNN